jgi:predicted DNA-binding protein (MmcQ/YjbR family)
MNAETIRKYCLSFPGAKENLQWGDDLCFKVNQKIFAIVGLDSVPQRMCFKCTPEKFAELCECDGIHPAPYVGRYKWVMLDRLNALQDGELKDLIRQSYEMVSAKQKPVRSARRSSREKSKKRAPSQRHS